MRFRRRWVSASLIMRRQRAHPTSPHPCNPTASASRSILDLGRGSGGWCWVLKCGEQRDYRDLEMIRVRCALKGVLNISFWMLSDRLFALLGVLLLNAPMNWGFSEQFLSGSKPMFVLSRLETLFKNKSQQTCINMFFFCFPSFSSLQHLRSMAKVCSQLCIALLQRSRFGESPSRAA